MENKRLKTKLDGVGEINLPTANEIERDLEIILENDFDELERIILDDVDLSDKTIEWLYDILRKDMNIFFRHVMQRLGHPDYKMEVKND